MRYSLPVSTAITSPSNERIKRLVRLRDRKARDSEEVFVVEGDRLLNRALDAGMSPLEVYAAEDWCGIDGMDVVVVARTVLDKASYRNRSEGVIAVFKQPTTDLATVTIGPQPLVLLADSIEKPGNLGAMLRTADAVGADLFVAIGERADFFNPNVLRSSTGALFTVPTARATWAGLNLFLEENSLRLVAATPDAVTPFWNVDMTGPIALLVGAEDTGIRNEIQEMADTLISIPMSGRSDSLNTSVSLALVAYEAIRQRRLSSR